MIQELVPSGYGSEVRERLVGGSRIRPRFHASKKPRPPRHDQFTCPGPPLVRGPTLTRVRVIGLLSLYLRLSER